MLSARFPRRIRPFACAVLALTVPTAAQYSVIGWGETVTNSSWTTGRYRALAAGWEHTLALRLDGTLVAWGDNRGNEPRTPIGQCSDIPPLPAGLTYIATSGGLRHSVALRSDGRILVWGDTQFEPWPLQLLPCVEVSAGNWHTLARFTDGSVTVGGIGEPPAPALPAGVVYVEISAGGHHSLARRSDGQVVAWGMDNTFGQCNVPALPAGLTYVEIDAGSEHSLGRRSDGSVVAWGNNTRNQSQVPPLPAGLTYVEIEAGGFHSLARRSDGSVVGWGYNYQSQLAIPAPPAGLVYVELAAGGLHSAGRLSDGSVVCWGDNNREQCNRAPLVPPGITYRAIGETRMGLMSDGSILPWSGDLPPPALPAGQTYVELDSTLGFALARRSDGAVVAWTHASFCGVGTVPALPPGLTYVEVAAGGTHALARRSDGNVVAWGCNLNGQCDVPALPPGVTYTAIAADDGNSAACRSDGRAVQWGYVQLEESEVPADPGELSYVEVAIGRWHTALRRSDGVVVGCGGPIACPFPPPPAGLSYVKIAAAQRSPSFYPPTYAVTYGRLSDGSVVAWGPGADFPNAQRLPAAPAGFSYLDIAAGRGVVYGLLGPTPVPTAPEVARVIPATLDALIPGTQRSVAFEGTGLDLVRELRLDGVPVDPQRYRIVSSALVLLDMPQVPSLGLHELTLSDGTVDSSVQLDVVATASPKYQLGNGDARNVIERHDGLSFIVAGPVGSLQHVYVSLSDLPSSNRWVSLGIGNQFTSLHFVGQFQIPDAGWLEVLVPPGALPHPDLGGLLLHSQTFTFAFPAPFATSNLQSIQLVQRAGRFRQP